MAPPGLAAAPRPGLVAAAPFAFSVGSVRASSVPYTWRPGCPVVPAQLRMLHLRYWGFDGKAHAGRMVVNEVVVDDVVKVFGLLYDERFPIWEMVPEDAYHGNDNRAAAVDDTSGFNCRYAVTSGPPQWSVHAYGEAIDVNDVQNPYVFGPRSSPRPVPPTSTAKTCGPGWPCPAANW